MRMHTYLQPNFVRQLQENAGGLQGIAGGFRGSHDFDLWLMPRPPSASASCDDAGGVKLGVRILQGSEAPAVKTAFEPLSGMLNRCSLGHTRSASPAAPKSQAFHVDIDHKHVHISCAKPKEIVGRSRSTLTCVAYGRRPYLLVWCGRVPPEDFTTGTRTKAC